MRQTTFKLKRVRKWLAAAGLFLCLLVIAVPVYAEEETTTAATTTATTDTETKKESETTKADEPEKKEPETVKEETLPTGNLTLVDDVISADDAHREFLTVVSKDGSYFYIVIDRDTEGAGNVYFLNLIDDQDLYRLTGEKAPEVVETETVVVDTEQQKEQVDDKQKTELTEEEKAAQKQKSLMITVGVGAAIVVGVVIYVLKKRKGKQTAKQEFDLSDFDDDDE